MDPAKPLLRAVADLAFLIAQHRLPATGVVDAVSLEIPIPQPVAGSPGGEGVALFGGMRRRIRLIGHDEVLVGPGPEESGEIISFPGANRTPGDVELNFVTVSVQAGELDRTPRVVGRRGFQVTRRLGQVPGPQAFGQEQREVLAHQLLGRVPQNRLRRRVHEVNGALLVDGDHHVGRGVGQGPERIGGERWGDRHEWGRRGVRVPPVHTRQGASSVPCAASRPAHGPCGVRSAPVAGQLQETELGVPSRRPSPPPAGLWRRPHGPPRSRRGPGTRGQKGSLPDGWPTR